MRIIYRKKTKLRNCILFKWFNPHAVTVDIADLKVLGFTQSESPRIDGGKICLVLRSVDSVEDATDLSGTQDCWKSLFVVQHGLVQGYAADV